MLENTTHIGDIRIRQIPSGYKVKETFVACVDCGIGRWVRVGREQKEQQRCKVCGAKHGFSPEHKEAILAGSKRRWAKPGAKEKQSQLMSGSNNHFYGKHHPPELLAKLAKVHELDIDVKPTREWGYFIGLVLGDGCIVNSGSGNYKITVSSSKPEIVDIFYDCIQRLGLHCCYEIGKRNPNYKDSRFQIAGGINYRATLLSKRIYDWMRPYKSEDYHFKVPNIIYEHMDMLKGFISGYFDAEGSVIKNSSSTNGYTINAFSKHKENLEQVKQCLDAIGINSYVDVRTDRFASELRIANYKDRVLFRDLVGFRIPRKQDKLNNMNVLIKQHCYDNNKRVEVRSLVERGLTYKQISRLTGVGIRTITYWKSINYLL